MPSGRRGSIERYKPRRSGSGTEQDSPTKSTGNDSMGNGGGITDWSAALDLEDEFDSMNIGNGEIKGADYWNDQELSSWADQVDAMSPKEEKTVPRFSEPPPQTQVPPQSGPRNNYTSQNYQPQKRANNIPPRFQQINKSDNYSNNGNNQQHQNRDPQTREWDQNKEPREWDQNKVPRDQHHNKDHRDQDWYQKMGRGRGRGAPLRPPADRAASLRPPSGAGRPPLGGNQTMAQRLLSSRHQTRQEDGAETNGHNGTKPFGRTQVKGHENGETNGFNGTRRYSDSQDEDKLSEASYTSSRKQGSNKSPGGGDLRDRLNKRMKDVTRSLNYETDSHRSNNSHSTERSYNNTPHNNEERSHTNASHNNEERSYTNASHNNHEERSYRNGSHNNHDDRVDDFVKGIRQSEEKRYENGHSLRDEGGDRGKSRNHDQERGHHDTGRGNYETNRGNHKNGHGQQLQRPKKNTENFNPSYEAPEMRILFAPPGRSKYTREVSNRDVLIVSDLFCDETDLRIYDSLMDELENCGVPENKLWQLWHGDSHVIADDKRTRWRESCPTFNMIIEKIQNYFDMDIKATRLNWYRDTSEWKPFHHDAAAMKADKARTQNFTVAVSFGVERDAAFEHAQTKTVISMPQPNGTIYTFSKDVNILWRHGILQMPPEKQKNDGRISIIAWGWIPQFDL